MQNVTKRLLIGGGFALCVAGVGSAGMPGHQPVDRNVLVSAGEPYPHVEPYLAVSPTDAGKLVAVAMTFPTAGSGAQLTAYHSADTGATWQRSGLSVAGGDPWLTFVGPSTVLLSHLPNQILRSRDHGRTWQPLSLLDDRGGPLDYTRMHASRGGHRVVIWGTQARPGASAPVIFVSGDSGASFSRPGPALQSTLNHQVGGFVVMPDNSIVASFHELDTNGRLLDSPRLWVVRSYDNGVTWTLPRLIAEGFLADSPEMAGAPSPPPGATHPRTYLAWTGVTPDRKSWGIYLTTSDDGGATWTRPRRVHGGGMAERGYLPHRPAMAVSLKGTLTMTWQQPDYARGTHCFALHVTHSRDGAESFSAPVPVADQTTCNTASGNDVPVAPGNLTRTVGRRFGDGGDYHGLVALPDESLVAVWADSRSGTYQLWARRIRPPIA